MYAEGQVFTPGAATTADNQIVHRDPDFHRVGQAAVVGGFTNVDSTIGVDLHRTDLGFGRDALYRDSCDRFGTF